MPKMKTVTFQNKFRLEIKGSFNKNAMILADVDDDKYNELAIGTLEGNLCIYKGLNLYPWKQGYNFGTVTTLCVGDICNIGQAYLIVLSGDGYCNVIHINKNSVDKDGKRLEDPIKSFYKQRLVPNINSCTISYVDHKTQLILGLTNCIIQSYVWKPHTDREKSTGNLIAMQKWEFPTQLTNFSIHKDLKGTEFLLVPQDGGSFFQINNENLYMPEIRNTKSIEEICFEPIELATPYINNKNVPTEILGNINLKSHDDAKSSTAIAVISMDGHIVFLENSEVIWYNNIHECILSAAKLDLLHDGSDQVILSCFDGQTFIFDNCGQCVNYFFDEAVAAFAAGKFCAFSETGDSKINDACIVYATFTNSVYLIYDIALHGMHCKSLISELHNQKYDIIHELKLELDHDLKNVIKHFLYDVKKT